MSQKRTDIEQKKEVVGGGVEKNKNKVGCSHYLNGCSEACFASLRLAEQLAPLRDAQK